jgi:aerobic carbon-monoxide dehydrogenase medium subunit
LLAGKTLDAATVEIAVASLKAELDPLPDLTHSPETKRHLATVLARRLLSAAHASRSAIADLNLFRRNCHGISSNTSR